LALQDIEAGMWKFRCRFLLSLLRFRTLHKSQKTIMEAGSDEPIEHAEACHYPFLPTNVPARRELHRERNFRIVRAVNCKTSPAISMGTTVLKFRAKLDYFGEVLVAVFVLHEFQPWDTICQAVRLTSVYCPGISMSSNFPCWNSVR
jgi:hypothetical protein